MSFHNTLAYTEKICLKGQPTLAELGNTPVAQDVNKFVLISTPLLLSCFIQSLDGMKSGMKMNVSVNIDLDKKIKTFCRWKFSESA